MFHASTVRIARDLLQPAAQLSGHARMTSETEGSDVFNSAFTSALDDRHNMVGCPGANKRLEPWELPPKHIERLSFAKTRSPLVSITWEMGCNVVELVERHYEING